MIKNVAVVSLSSGIIGEDFIKHEVEIGINRLIKLGLNVKFMPNALKGMEYLRNHPEARASDLLQAFKDPEIDMILCAIGGDDTYRLLPFLFDNNELETVVSNKVFLGFSDTTFNHFMLNKLGIKSFYGQSFLADICEIGNDMLPYSRKYFEELLNTETIREIRPSDIWYEARTEFGVEEIGKPLIAHENFGFELLRGKERFSGKILGGCIDSIYDFFYADRYDDIPVLCEKYGLFPSVMEWNEKIILFETSEEKMAPDKLKKVLCRLNEEGIFDVVSGVIVGKPMDEQYVREYKQVILDTITNKDISIVYNINVGHAQPRCIIPFGINAIVDVDRQVIIFEN